MKREEPKYCGLKLEWLGYTVAILCIIKCIINVIMYSVLLELIRKKMEEYSTAGVCFKIIGLVATTAETISSALVIIGINETIPWILIPWMIIIVIRVPTCITSFILYLTDKHWSGIVAPSLELIAVCTDVLGLVIIIKLYKWLRRKQQEKK